VEYTYWSYWEYKCTFSLGLADLKHIQDPYSSPKYWAPTSSFLKCHKSSPPLITKSVKLIDLWASSDLFGQWLKETEWWDFLYQVFAQIIVPKVPKKYSHFQCIKKCEDITTEVDHLRCWHQRKWAISKTSAVNLIPNWV